jgi:hypothetical protein
MRLSFKESRMEFDNATNFDRKAGGSPTIAFAIVTWKGRKSFGRGTLVRTRGTRPALPLRSRELGHRRPSSHLS